MSFKLHKSGKVGILIGSIGLSEQSNGKYHTNLVARKEDKNVTTNLAKAKGRLDYTGYRGSGGHTFIDVVHDGGAKIVRADVGVTEET